jgi:hypothetical protein
MPKAASRPGCLAATHSSRDRQAADREFKAPLNSSEARKVRANFTWSYSMNENINTRSADISLSVDKRPWHPANTTTKRQGPAFPPDEDIELWLEHNAPSTFQQLVDIRYSLYHQCSRADFTVANVMGDRFNLTGRHSTLRVVSDNARRFLLWKLRLLGRRMNWISALPRTKSQGIDKILC